MGEIVTRFLGVLGDMTEDAFESFALVGTSPKPKKASISEEVLRKGLGEMGNCPIPRERWDELVPAGLPERLRGVRLPEGKGYASPETEVMLEVLKGQVVLLRCSSSRVNRGVPTVPVLLFPRMTSKPR